MVESAAGPNCVKRNTRVRSPRRFECQAIVVCLFALAMTVCARRLDAQGVDSFEGGRPRWMLVDSDCRAQQTMSELSAVNAHRGSSCELIELLCNSGSYAYLALPIEPSAIIAEFNPSLWVQCMSGRIRLGANIVFPNAQHPADGTRLNVIVWGTIYEQPGEWQQLEVRDIPRLLSQEMIALRQKLGGRLNFDEAYIDSLILNAYTGPGRYRLKTDDLDMQGMIPISSLGQPVPADWRARWRWRDGALNDEQRWDQNLSTALPVWWQYQGESLPWLHSLGFRGVLLGRFPSEGLLEEVRGAQLSVICPPPAQAVTVNSPAWQSVKGWMVGAAVDGRGLDTLKSEVSRLQQFDDSLRRSTIVEAMEEYWSFSRVVDELIIPAPSLLSAGTTKEKQGWLISNLQEAQKRNSGWVSVTTDAVSSWRDQVRAAQKIIEPQQTELETTDPIQLRMQVARAVAAGARGFLFRSSTPLDVSATDEKQIRVAAMRTVNRDLNFVSPWIQSGIAAPVPKLDREDYQAAAWTASRSFLVMFINSSNTADIFIPPTRDRALKASMPLPVGIRAALRVTNGTVQSLLLTPGPEGMTWEIPNPGPIEWCVLTDNPLVERYVSRQLSQSAAESAEDSLDVASHQLQIATKLTTARWPMINEELPRRYMSTIAAAQQRVEQGYDALRRNRPANAVDAANQAYDAAQLIVHESFTTATANLSTPQSSPLVLSPASLPYHWQLARACERSVWRNVPLPGNELTNLQAMQEAGWSQQRRLNDRADMLVELVSQGSAESSKPGIRLAAFPKPGLALPGGYEGASIWVRSAPAMASQGELVRVTARAIIRVAPRDPHAGLLVYDNKGGPALGQLVRGQTGEVIPIELYRFITDDTPFRILTELRGAGDIVLEDIRLDAIQPAATTSTFQTSPIMTSQTLQSDR